MNARRSFRITMSQWALTFGFAVLSLITASTWAQSFRGSIHGIVSDPSGSVIAGAKINAKSVATGQQREATTGQDGGYVLAELPAGIRILVLHFPVCLSTGKRESRHHGLRDLDALPAGQAANQVQPELHVAERVQPREQC